MTNRRSPVTAQLSAFEGLEARQMLDALPVGASYIPWGEVDVPAQRGSYIIGFEGQRDNAQAELLAREVITRLGLTATEVRGFARGQYAEFTTRQQLTPEQVGRVMIDLPYLKGVQPNIVQEVQRVPNDPRFNELWGLRNTGQQIAGNLGTANADIHAAQAWDTTIGSRSVVVAVIDTGIDLTHPDLIQNLWVNPGEIAGDGIDNDGNGFVDDVNGYDFGENKFDPQDRETGGHGTQVASVIGAVGNNGIGITGVAWNVSLMGLKIANRFGGLTTAAIVAAHDYATMMIGRGTNIVASNNSYGGFNQAFYRDAPTGFDAERDAIARFVAAGATFVTAAGNSSFDNDNPQFTFYPSSYNVPGVISVAATDNNDQLANFSNYGAQTVELGAPGVNILMAQLGGGYGYNSGTSMASPMVAGAVALLKTVKPNASAVEIREALFNSVDPLPALQGRVRSGGRLNVARALQVIQIDGPVVRSVSPGPVTGQTVSGTTTPLSTVTVNFSKDIATGSLSTSQVSLVGAGGDNIFGTGDDIAVQIAGIARSNTDVRQVTITLNVAALSGGRLPVGQYRLTLQPGGFRDQSNNFLNGNNAAGSAEVYNFRVVAVSGDNEPNDSLTEATPVNYSANGSARFTGVTLGNGIFGLVDVDMYRLDLTRGGEISAEVFAKRLPAGSNLDSYLRLFDGNGNEIASNDQTFGDDSAIDFFVRTAGTYYIGVSGFGNDRYNPRVAGSGTSQSTGIYDLAINVRLSSDDVVTSVLYTSPNLQPGQDAFLNSDAPAGPTTRIPPNAPTQTQGTTTSFIDIADTRQIIDLNVRVRITHPFTGDLTISLIAPTGTEVALVNRRGGAGDNFTNTSFDDEAAGSVINASAPFSGSLRPETALGFFDGQRANGRWTLKIVDNSALNSGQLLNWSLEFTFLNDIFGPFESNDTLGTAKALQEISGTGAATRTAFIGDGGFGNFDRDVFSFTATAGSSLVANVTSAGVLNTALRLFDANGTQILLSNPASTLNSNISSFVFASGGTYYLAISEGSNVAYDPKLVATGAIAATTGSYTLEVTLAAGVSDPSQTLQGDHVEVSSATTGVFQSGGSDVGLRFNGTEFLPLDNNSARSLHYFGLTAGGSSFTNNNRGQSSLPFAVTNESDPLNQRTTSRADFRGLTVERSLSYALGDNFVAIDVFLTNTTATVFSGASWAESFNPNPGISLGDGIQTTNNDVVSTTYARASYVNNEFGQGLTVGLAAPASDVRATAKIISGSSTPRDSRVVLAAPVNDPDGVASDSLLAMVYDLGSINPGQVVSMRYFIFFGSTQAEADALNTTMNAGGAGHLTSNLQQPATEMLSDGSTAPLLPYKVYFPEGAVNANINEFIPISNPNDQPTRIVAIARYESGVRDQILFDQVIGGRSRSGFTITTPALYAANQQLVRKDPNGGTVTYALELRADKPVAATFSHYDANILPRNSAVGEAFTSRTDTTWSFASVTKGNNIDDFILWYNTTNTVGKITLTFYPTGGGQAYDAVFDLSPYYRGGMAINFGNNPITLSGTSTPATMPDGTYGVVVSSTVPIVASLSHYDRNSNAVVAEGSLGAPGSAATSGVIAEGQRGLNATAEVISVLNPGNAAATVQFSFLFDNGTAFRAARTFAARSAGKLDVLTLPNFPSGRPYAVYFESDQAVVVDVRSNAFGQQFASASGDRAYTLWTFGEGFRPGDNSGHPGVTEHLRLYNPSSTDTEIEITIAYDGVPGSETFRRTLPARRVTEFNIDQFITGSRRQSFQYYSTTIKSPTPIVAYMLHLDSAFPGGFGSLGTPLGRSAQVS